MDVTMIAEVIQKKRKILNVDQQTVCDYAGISVNTLSAIEKGKANPSLNTLISICEFLGLEVKVT